MFIVSAFSLDQYIRHSGESESESVSRLVVSDSAIPWSVALQAPLSIEFSRQGYWGGLPFHSPGDLPNPGVESGSPALQADSLPSEPPAKSDSVLYIYILFQILFHYRLLPDAKYNSLCYTVGPYSMDLSLKKNYWNIVALQLCVGVYHTVK